MELDALLLSRIQFGFVVAFHILFPAFTIGLASYIAGLEALWLKTGNEKYFAIANFWTRIFAVSFGMGVVSGIVMSYQFGTNWSRFADLTDDVAVDPFGDAAGVLQKHAHGHATRLGKAVGHLGREQGRDGASEPNGALLHALQRDVGGPHDVAHATRRQLLDDADLAGPHLVRLHGRQRAARAHEDDVSAVPEVAQRGDRHHDGDGRDPNPRRHGRPSLTGVRLGGRFLIDHLMVPRHRRRFESESNRRGAFNAISSQMCRC